MEAISSVQKVYAGCMDEKPGVATIWVGSRSWHVQLMEEVKGEYDQTKAKSGVELCKVCFTRFATVEVCEQGHLLCDPCYTKIKEGENPICAECRGTLTHTDLSKRDRRMLNSTMLECLECESLVSYIDAEQHVPGCKPRLKICEHEGCDFKGNSSELKNHAGLCRKRTVTEGQLTLPYDDMEAVKRLKRDCEALPKNEQPAWDEQTQRILGSILPRLLDIAFLPVSTPRLEPARETDSKGQLCAWGCNYWAINPYDLKRHYDVDCPEKTVSCDWCRVEYSRKNLPSHREVCDWRIVPCDYECGQTFAAKQRNQHQRSCTKYPVQCEYCNGCFARGALPEHKANLCLERPISCRHCLNTLPFSHMESCQRGQPLQAGPLHLVPQQGAIGPVYMDSVSNDPETLYLVLLVSELKTKTWEGVKASWCGEKYEITICIRSIKCGNVLVVDPKQISENPKKFSGKFTLLCETGEQKAVMAPYLFWDERIIWVNCRPNAGEGACKNAAEIFVTGGHKTCIVKLEKIADSLPYSK